MKKKLQLALNKYKPIPPKLQGESEESPKTIIDLDLAALYHHFYLDTYGTQPPNPDPAQFEHMRFLVPDDKLRFQGEGWRFNQCQASQIQRDGAGILSLVPT